MKSGKLFILCINQKKLLKKYNTKMDTMLMDSEISKTSKPHVLILNITDKIYLRRILKSIALSNLSIYCTWKNISS